MPLEMIRYLSLRGVMSLNQLMFKLLEILRWKMYRSAVLLMMKGTCGEARGFCDGIQLGEK